MSTGSRTGFEVLCVEQLHARGTAYALLARLLLHEVSPVLLESLRQTFGTAAAENAAGEGERLFHKYFKATADSVEEHLLLELATDYAGLFLNAGRHPIHPYESCYRSDKPLLMQASRDEVRALLASRGLRLAPGSREPEDHLGNELEGMAQFCALAAEAFERGAQEEALALIEAQRQLLHEHLLCWAPAFCQHLAERAETVFYRAVGCLIHDHLRLEENLWRSV